MPTSVPEYGERERETSVPVCRKKEREREREIICGVHNT